MTDTCNNMDESYNNDTELKNNNNKKNKYMLCDSSYMKFCKMHTNL